jgi:hypothetical protein
LALNTFEKYSGSLKPHKKDISFTLINPLSINVHALVMRIVFRYSLKVMWKFFLKRADAYFVL